MCAYNVGVSMTEFDNYVTIVQLAIALGESRTSYSRGCQTFHNNLIWRWWIMVCGVWPGHAYHQYVFMLY